MYLRLWIVPESDPNKDSEQIVVALSTRDSIDYPNLKGWIAQSDVVYRYVPEGYFVVRIAKESRVQK